MNSANAESRLYQGDCPVIPYFEALSAIPRSSGHERAASDYVAAFARERGYEAVQDESWNLVIRKPASPGYEDAPTVIVQGHLDMVGEKNEGVAHDFLKDPIRLRLEGDFMSAEGTTLGGDDGLAVAFAMALLAAGDAEHPPLEILLTTEEETSMKGARKLDPGLLRGRRMINLDSDREGILYVSSAGGVRAYHTVPVAWAEGAGVGLPGRLRVSGLAGGHSGDDIVHERANACELLGRILDGLRKELPYAVASVRGGLASNAIPREAEACLYVQEVYWDQAETAVRAWEARFRTEYAVADPQVRVTFEAGERRVDLSASHAEQETVSAGTGAEAGPRVFSETSKRALVDSLLLLPNGVLRMDKAIPGLPRTSTNVGVVAMTADGVRFESAARSSLRSELDAVVTRMEALASALDCAFEASDYYPGWPYRMDSQLRDIFRDVYLREHGKPMDVKAVHAGIECGILADKIPGLDAVSYGPDLYAIHTPDERFSISSVERTWRYLLQVLRELKV
ncbi:aminoacyl-histidine dipeptidase [Cohnella sp. JJ-181]|uniref:aminoacyl-histidine dipeptidase n=1 Tax=Cohnella rhizoplanae TaxID=2974897 RepID=UPI0022FFB0CD|nr:aminoacyl-histidine dipeptidase [Cohnella sp. JJ-181]CAI6038793.1 Cytosol non-specific dipeptidase [Cohnella sp. JJ-181]